MSTLEDEVAKVASEFDSTYYLATYPDVAASSEVPVVHFCANGWREGRNPNDRFSTRFYLDRYRDVADAGINPFYHFLVAGRQEGRAPLPEQQVSLAEFDADFYLAQYPDVAASGVDPQMHYMAAGWREGRDPSPEFSTRFYLEANPDVQAANVNPFVHYVMTGRAEGRQSQRAIVRREPEPEPEPLSPMAAEFDADYYLATYPDVAEAGADPLTHFSTVGWKEGRDPSADFSTRYYLENNLDVAAAGINPFEHFVLAGRNEGREGRRPVTYKLEALVGLRTLSEVSKAWLRKVGPTEVLTKSAVADVLAGALLRDKFKLAISVSHDNYRKSPGGVQLCIQREEECFVREGFEYLNLHPWQPLPSLPDAETSPDPLVNLTMNGVAVGTAATSTVTEALREVKDRLEECEVIVHHLLGHSPERITELCQAVNDGKCRFWLHDFFSICPSYVLQRNGITYCGAPPVYSNACVLCVYGPDRVEHGRRMTAMFSALTVDVISPSEVTRQLWLDRAGLPFASMTVAPHMELKFLPRKVPAPVKDDSRITIAFTGTPSAPKGWKKFEALVNRYRGKPRFRFMYFGTTAPEVRGLVHVPVHVTTDTPDAMVDALKAEGVDLVMHWASWPETFSFSTYEALAASAFVITNPVSGNVARVVSDTGRGIVLADDDDLDRFIAGPGIKELADRARAARSAETVEITLSTMTHGTLAARNS